MKDIFCSKCQLVTPHQGVVDANGEFVFTCTNAVDGVACDRFVKFPADTTPESFAAYLIAHQAANEGQVSVEAQEKMLATLLGDLPTASPDVQVPAEDTAVSEAPAA
jgi:hypothetical protein